LGDLYAADSWQRLPNVRMHLRSTVDGIDGSGFTVAGERIAADGYICALPFERLELVGLPAPRLEHSPITGVHLWFDREITTLPHATLLDRTMQWMFNKAGGRYLQLVVSASRSLTNIPKADVIALALQELAEFFPAVANAKLERSHVIKEQHATFSARPGTGDLRPGAATCVENIFLAGDWTRSGWPATMEGAVRSGYIAAEAVTQAAGQPIGFLRP